MKKIIVTLDEKSIDNAIKELEKFQKWLVEKTPEFLQEMASLGLEIASVNFAQAQYDGFNDVKCSVEDRGETCRAIVAVGNAALFIEFGTGVTYPDTHPEAAQNGMVRGQYGAGHGKQPTWGYYGDPGTNGEVHTKKNGKSIVLTHGNPANACMYFTVSELEMRLDEIARKVFCYD